MGEVATARLRGEEKNGTEEWERLRGLGGEGKHGTKKKLFKREAGSENNFERIV